MSGWGLVPLPLWIHRMCDSSAGGRSGNSNRSRRCAPQCSMSWNSDSSDSTQCPSFTISPSRIISLVSSGSRNTTHCCRVLTSRHLKKTNQQEKHKRSPNQVLVYLYGASQAEQRRLYNREPQEATVDSSTQLGNIKDISLLLPPRLSLLPPLPYIPPPYLHIPRYCTTVYLGRLHSSTARQRSSPCSRF